MGNHDRHGQHRYGSLHKKVRRHFVLRMERGEVFNCWRCGLPIMGPLWDLGHVDDGRGVSGRWPEHRACNRRTLSHIVEKYSLGSAAQKRVRPEPAPRSSREW